MKIAILGGGTISKVREHLALCAPAYGGTARRLAELIHHSSAFNEYQVDLYLTKMADKSSKIETIEDLHTVVTKIIEDKEVKLVLMTCAVCDFYGEITDGDDGADIDAKRLSSKHEYQMSLYPNTKIISEIRKKRSDIFLVGFKTTVGLNVESQYKAGLRMLKSNKCNLVLGNDLETKMNMLIVPEENYYDPTTNRSSSLGALLTTIISRFQGTYHATDFIQKPNTKFNIENTSKCFVDVMKYLFKNNAYVLNENGFTAGHFCYRIPTVSIVSNDITFLSSQRKVNHNRAFHNGLTKCIYEEGGGSILANGMHKPSVGARSQAMLLEKFPDYDCIVHFHGKLVSQDINTRDQIDFQCGSLECGKNTVAGMKDYNDIKAVHLNKHGPNILFKSDEDPEKIINFIKSNWMLGIRD